MRWTERLLGRETGGVFGAMLTLAAGGAAAKLIGLVSIPIITRLYSPAEMGLLSAFTAIVAILSPFATLRYVNAIPIPRRDATAVNLLSLNFMLLISTTLLLSAIVWVAGPKLLAMASLGSLTPYVWLIVAGVFVTAFYELITMWGTRKKAFGTLALSQTNQAITGSLVKIGLAMAGMKPVGLLIGQIAQQGGGAIPLLRLCISNVRQHQKRIKLRTAHTLAAHYHDMPLYRLPSHLLLMLAMQGPGLFSAQLFGLETAGQLGLALTALALPLSLVGTTMANAYFAEISAIGRRNPARVLEITRSVTLRLVLLSTPAALILMVAGPWLFSTAFGSRWQLAGEFARILSIYLVFQFVSSPLGNSLTLFRRQDLFLKMNIWRFAMIAAIFLTARFLHWDSKTTLLVYSMLLSVHYFISNRLIFRVIKQQIKEQSQA